MYAWEYSKLSGELFCYTFDDNVCEIGTGGENFVKLIVEREGTLTRTCNRNLIICRSAAVIISNSNSASHRQDQIVDVFLR